MDKLTISGSLPQAYIKWLKKSKEFYSVAIADTAIQTSLSRMKITADDLNTTSTLINDMERALYMKEKGESHVAIKIKDAVFGKLDDWMSEFYAVAKIALEDNPQLLESFGKLVRS